MAQTTVLFGTLTITGGQTLSEPAASSTTGAPTWSIAKSEYNTMDVMLNVKTLTGTSFSVSIQERFSDAGFMETANSGTISAVGKYYIANGGQTGQTGAAKIIYGFAALGKGTDKQMISTTSSISALTADVYLIFYK